MSIIDEFLQENSRRRLTIQCVGDIMIDEYYKVKVSRISPEFPMPIMSSVDEKPITLPGGAANVAHQFRHFNNTVKLYGYADKYTHAILANHGVSLDGIVDIFPYDGKNPVKRRFLDGNVQVNRWDIEQPEYGMSKWIFGAEAILMDMFDQNQVTDVAVFTDYDKGLFQAPERWLAKSPALISIVDPKKGPADRWKGCTVFKPNNKEAMELSGRTDWKEQCSYFRQYLETPNVVITQGGDGVVGCFKGGYFEIRPDKSCNVRSVCGAGDCFVAFLAMAMGYGFEVNDASEIAFQAGARYVGKGMNQPVVPSDLCSNKLISKLSDLKKRDYKLVFSNGCFDILHAGHIRTLEEAKKKGDKLVVAINSDASVKRLKGESRPRNNLFDRMEVLKSLSCVDFVAFFDEDTPLNAIKECRPDVLVKGSDYRDKVVVGEEVVPEVHLVELVPGISTTEILKGTPLISPGEV